MVKKRRRKDLRQPDEFVTYTMKIGQWVREHQRLVIFSSVVIIIVVVAIALTIQLVESSQISSSAGLWPAIETAAAPVVDPDDEEEVPEKIQHFQSYLERAKASEKGFQKVHDTSRESGAGRLATLGLASAKFTAGDFAEARRLYENFAANTGGFDNLKSIAVEGIGLCFEAQKNYDQALEQFRQLEKLDNGDSQDLAKYHQARMLEKLNKRSEAADLYRGVVQRSEQATEKMVTNFWVQERSEARLAVLDPGADVLRDRSKGRGSDLLKQILSKNPQGMPRPPESSE